MIFQKAIKSSNYNIPKAFPFHGTLEMLFGQINRARATQNHWHRNHPSRQPGQKKKQNAHPTAPQLLFKIRGGFQSPATETLKILLFINKIYLLKWKWNLLMFEAWDFYWVYYFIV